MKLKVLIPVLLVTHAVAGLAGFFIAKTLLVKDAEWVEKDKRDQKRQQELDAAVDAPASPPTAVETAATPPAGFVPSVRQYDIQGKGMSRVSFTSDAPLEEIVGTTTRIGGSFTVDHGNLTASKAGDIIVEVGTLKTGIDLRDEHLQGEGWFNTAEHPNAIFELSRVETSDKALWFGRTAKARLHGKLIIRGIARPVVAEADIGYFEWNEKLGKFGIKSDILRIKASFQVALSDFGMSAGVIGQKVAEVVDVSLSLTAIARKSE